MNRRRLWAEGVALILLIVVAGAAALTPVGAGYAKDEDASRAKCSEATLEGTWNYPDVADKFRLCHRNLLHCSLLILSRAEVA